MAAGVATLGVVVALGVGVGASRLGGSDAEEVDGAVQAANKVLPAAANLPALDLAPQPPAPPGPPAPTPAEAVARFLAAEVAADFATSYGLLAAADRATYAGPAGWTRAHGFLYPVTNFTLGDVTERDGRAEVAVRTELRSGLDEVMGLVPPAAASTWVAVPEDGGWRVAFDQSTISLEYRADDDAPAGVRAWVEARRACEAAPEYDGGLLGVASLADRLCRAEGETRVGTPGLLDDPVDAAPFLAAFGEDAGRWARVVPVDGPVALRAVVAPLGERWVVVGVLPRAGGER